MAYAFKFFFLVLEFVIIADFFLYLTPKYNIYVLS